MKCGSHPQVATTETNAARTVSAPTQRPRVAADRRARPFRAPRAAPRTRPPLMPLMPLAPPGGAAQTLEARLSRLTHAQLLRLAALGCNESTQVMAEASRMLAPLWAADRAADEVFLSTDLLDCILASLGAQDAAVASVCKVWAASWATLAARRRYVDTKPLRLQMSEPMFAMTTMLDGTLCFNLNPWDSRPLSPDKSSLRFMSPHSYPAQAVPHRLCLLYTSPSPRDS